ncbi:hypothetical protein SPHS6_03866 [Sphingobium sp. S6]|nr:hypothetical protein SPHS6_03866 [Sphingobium sp. S6]CAD7342095.1 hypothetical protein SPHS8_03877 [Sphingobium sp. S8]
MFDLGWIDGCGSVGDLGDGDGGVAEERHAGVCFAATHDVEEVGCDLDVGAAGAGYFLEGGAEGPDLGGGIKFDCKGDAERGGEFGEFNEPFGAAIGIAVVAQDIGKGRAQCCAGFKRGNEVLGVGAPCHGEGVDEVDLDPGGGERVAGLAQRLGIAHQVVGRHGGQHLHGMEERADAFTPHLCGDLRQLPGGGVGDGDMVERQALVGHILSSWDLRASDAGRE